MRLEQTKWNRKDNWEPEKPGVLGDSARLAFVFGGTIALKQEHFFREIRNAYPGAHIMGCSTAGEIYDTHVSDDTIVVTAVQFEHTEIEGVSVNINEVRSSFEAGERLARALPAQGLNHVFVLSDGLRVNGSELVSGLTSVLPGNVKITGGLSGDGSRFEETVVIWDGPAEKDVVAAIGFYGDRIKIGFGSLGGWDQFGPERLITRSKDNTLYELDGQSALDLYKKYLGDHADGLPATGLLFPLSLRTENKNGLVRTILAVDEQEQSLTFAGDVPEGTYARLMRANFNRLIDGAADAAETSRQALGGKNPELAILISCVGRKMVLKQRIEEEVECVREVLGNEAVLAGFYSYGEISPFSPKAKCELHNQTMTITTFSEE